MNKNLLELLVCPLCKGKLTYDKPKQLFVCQGDKLAYPIKNNIPIMLESEATQLKDL